MPHDMPPREELLREALSEDEVIEILTRLSAEELGGSELATVAAVSEATGASPEAIGRMLADIRQEDLREKYGSHIESHGRQIGELREQTRDLSDRVRPSTFDPEVAEEIEEMARERIWGRKAAVITVVVLLLLVVVINVIKADQSPRQPEPPPGGTYTTTPLKNGGTLNVNETGRMWVTTPGGGWREPTEEEIKEGEPWHHIPSK